MEEIMNDMDLALEGVVVSNSNKNVERGLAILEHIFPTFYYSSKDLSLNEKVREIKNYCFLKGYISNEAILELLASYKVGISR